MYAKQNISYPNHFRTDLILIDSFRGVDYKNALTLFSIESKGTADKKKTIVIKSPNLTF